MSRSWRAGIDCPWPYYAARNTRTIYDLAKEWGGETAPVALDDCLAQVKCLMSALNFLRA